MLLTQVVCGKGETYTSLLGHSGIRSRKDSDISEKQIKADMWNVYVKPAQLCGHQV